MDGNAFEIIASDDDFGSGFKTCNTCGKEKPLVEFHAHKATGDGRRGICKVCRSKKTAASSKKSDLLERAAVAAWKELIMEKYF